MLSGIGGGIIAPSAYGYIAPYGTFNLTNTSPIQTWQEPLTLLQVKNFLKIPILSPSDPYQDMELNGYISAARFQAEMGQGRDLVVKQWDLVMDYWITYFIQLRGPLQSVQLVQYTDNNFNTTVLQPGTGYIVDTSKDPGVIVPPYNTVWPDFTVGPSSSVLVRFTSGRLPIGQDPWWNEQGQTVMLGMLQLISDWYNRKLPFEKTSEESAYGPTAAFTLGGYRFVR